MGRFRGCGPASIDRGPYRRHGAIGNEGWVVEDEVRRCAGNWQRQGWLCQQFSGSAIRQFVGCLGGSATRPLSDWVQRRVPLTNHLAKSFKPASLMLMDQNFVHKIIDRNIG